MLMTPPRVDLRPTADNLTRNYGVDCGRCFPPPYVILHITEGRDSLATSISLVQLFSICSDPWPREGHRGA